VAELALVFYFQPSLIFASVAAANQSGATFSAPLYGLLFALTTNIRPDLKGLPVTNTLTYFAFDKENI